MYIDSMRHVLAETQSIFVDVSSGNNIMYLPIEQLIKEGKTAQKLSMTTVDEYDASEISLPAAAKNSVKNANSGDNKVQDVLSRPSRIDRNTPRERPESR